MIIAELRGGAGPSNKGMKQTKPGQLRRYRHVCDSFVVGATGPGRRVTKGLLFLATL